MFKIKDAAIHVTRSDVGAIDVNMKDETGNIQMFKIGDVVRLNVMQKKRCDLVVLRKDVKIKNECEIVTLYLTSDDTSFCGPINKPVQFWYEIELNPETTPQTLIGYDEDGPKLFMVYPEGVKIDE